MRDPRYPESRIPTSTQNLKPHLALEEPRRRQRCAWCAAVLAVELPVIMNAGYIVERIEAVDMFPHTDHIETVVRLVRT